MRLRYWVVALAASWLLGFSVNRAARDTDLSWTVSLQRQKTAIADSIPGPGRILLVGGSHAHYSVSAETVEDELGCPAVNMGLHAGLGVAPILRIARDTWRAGDLVVFFPEYGLLASDQLGWLAPSFEAASGRPGIAGLDLERQVQGAFRSGTTSMHGLLKSLAVEVFGRSGRASTDVGPRGDVTRFLSDLEPVPAPDLSGAIGPDVRQWLLEWVEQAERDSVRVVFALPRVLVDADHLDAIRADVESLVSELSEIGPVVPPGPSLNLETDPAGFSDTFYHATESTRASFSRGVARGLQTFAPDNCGR